LKTRKGKLGGEIGLFLASLGLGIVFAFAIADASYLDAHSPSGILVLASRFTAILGTYLVLIALLMIARIPWLERSIGFDSLVAYHRKLGPTILSLIILHVIFVVIGYSITDKKSAFSEFQYLISHYSWMKEALVALIIFIIIGFTSMNSIRRRINYEQWWNVHIASYFGIALAFMHQILNGSLFIYNSAAKLFWMTLYLYTGIAMLMWRFLIPILRSLRHNLRVDRVEIEAPGIVSIYIKGRSILRLHAKGGNFFEWRFLTKGIWNQAHPYSLSAVPTDTQLRITVKDLGNHSRALASVKPETRVIAEGPYGILLAKRAIGKRILLIGGGIGITPLRALLQEFPEDATIDLIYRTLKKEELALKEELDALDIKQQITIHYLVGSPEEFSMSPKELQKLIPNIAKCDVFVCGPAGLAAIVRHSVESLGVPSSKFHIESFSFSAEAK
jgi:predicted ferric reductase